jgi:hypothetical protein
VYISTPYDPRDPSGATFTTSYEIYKGVTANGGASWAWSAITENSVIDNLRPIIPDPHGGDPTVIWFRGTYSTAQSINATIVGIVDRSDEELGLVNYVDATTSNTTRANGAAIGATGPNGSQGANDGLWHERTGFGNGGSVLTSRESGGENAPTLKTTIAEVADGLYDVFAFFWSDDDEDWRIMAGLESNNLIDFRRYGSQHAEADQFLSIESVAADNNDLQLFRAYLGRTEVADGSVIDVFIDDWQSLSGGAIRTWYDGVGYALVTDVMMGLAGDYNNNGVVDAADYTVWRDHLGDLDETAINDNGDGGGITMSDYTYWKDNFGNTLQGSGQGNAQLASVPEPASAALFLMLTGSLLFRWDSRGRTG